MSTTGERTGAGAALSRPQVRLPLEMGLLLLGAELTRRLELPWSVAGLVFAALALVQGLRALRAMGRARRRGEDGVTPFGTAMVAVGVALAGGLLAVQALTLAFYPVVAEHRECTERALTNTARAACDERLQERLDEIVLSRVSPGA
ncbi:hypothetical protein [Aquipuribacter nitratireducens]|uniref:Integral membrane protein n=1 Tax=Aquipuribacter nitratireducens TaxID=650104 RepID=A0ABW0GLZ2_9MICO